MQAFVLCAGRGERLRPLTDHLPKPLIPVLGKPLLAIILDQLQDQGFKRIALNTWYLKEKLKAWVKDYALAHPDLKLQLFEEPELLGPCGALRYAASFFNAPTLVINGDILTNFPLKTVYEARARQGVPCLMLVRKVPGLNKVRVEGNRVTGFGEDSPEGWAFTGIQVVTPKWVAALPPERDMVPAYQKLLAQGFTIGALAGAGFYWQDLGTPASYQKAQEDLLSGRALVPFAPPHAS